MSSLPLAVTAASVVFLDVLTKLAARALLNTNEVQLLPGVTLRVMENSRGPFGLGPLWLALVASFLVLVALSRHRHALRPPRATLHLSLGLLLGGGVSNFAERLLFSRTTDLLVLGNLTALNAADVSILLGLVGLLSVPARATAHS